VWDPGTISGTIGRKHRFYDMFQETQRERSKLKDEVPESVVKMGRYSISPIARPEIFSRLNFLEALQIHRPQFWRDLRETSKEESQEAIAAWMMRSGVTDDWFITVIWDTCRAWRAAPASPAAQLQTARPWFWYAVVNDAAERDTFQIPPFSPQFLVPEVRPAPVTEDGKPESLVIFEQRMRKFFEAQLADYIKYHKSLLSGRRDEHAKHAAWTALAFTGESWIDIAATWAGLRNSDRPDKVVAVAVRRFAERIGLTFNQKAQ
jgi:hypothetical protein